MSVVTGLRAGRGNSKSSEPTETFTVGHGEENFEEGISDSMKRLSRGHCAVFSLMLWVSIKDKLEEKRGCKISVPQFYAIPIFYVQSSPRMFVFILNNSEMICMISIQCSTQFNIEFLCRANVDLET